MKLSISSTSSLWRQPPYGGALVPSSICETTLRTELSWPPPWPSLATGEE